MRSTTGRSTASSGGAIFLPSTRRHFGIEENEGAAERDELDIVGAGIGLRGIGGLTLSALVGDDRLRREVHLLAADRQRVGQRGGAGVGAQLARRRRGVGGAA